MRTLICIEVDVKLVSSDMVESASTHVGVMPVRERHDLGKKGNVENIEQVAR
jgi:hypothetical protein